MAEDGYDVYLVSSRGTLYSQERTDGLKKTDKEYWNYSYADLGIYDDVANIKAIKERSGVQKVYYIGFSSST